VKALIARRAARQQLVRAVDRERRSHGRLLDAGRRARSHQLRQEAEGWADVLRAPFESQGADVREL
jgi:hypothetical protein